MHAKSGVINIFFIFLSADCAKYPSDLPKCKLEDSVCLANVMTTIIRYSKDEIKGLNLVQLDPLELPRISTDDVPEFSNIITTKLDIWNSSVRGYSNSKILSAEFQRNKNMIKGEIVIESEYLTLDGMYKAAGHVLTVPINGQGKFNMAMTGSKTTLKLLSKIIEQDGEQYMNLTKFKEIFNLTHASIHFDNLFNGNQMLGQTINDLINSNWREIFTIFNKPLMLVFGTIFEKVVRNVLDFLPVNELFIQ